MVDYPRLPAFDVPTLYIPTANNDIWSFKRGYFSRPSTPHEHVAFTRGDEFGGDYCLGNPSYAPSRVADQHEMRDFGFNFASGEHRQTEKSWGPLFTDDPFATLGTVEVWEIKTGWAFRAAETTTVAGFPAGFQTGYWHWGLGLQFQDQNDLTLATNFFTVNFYNADSQTFLRATVGNTFGNVFQGGTIFAATPYNLMPIDYDTEDLRLQIIRVIYEKIGDPDKWVEVYDYYVAVDGFENFRYVGRQIVDVGNINPRRGVVFKPQRIRNIILGSSFQQNRSLNSVRYQTTRYWDLLSYVWNPVDTGSEFIWVY